jgi:hypothetical protein
MLNDDVADGDIDEIVEYNSIRISRARPNPGGVSAPA